MSEHCNARAWPKRRALAKDRDEDVWAELSVMSQRKCDNIVIYVDIQTGTETDRHNGSIRHCDESRQFFCWQAH